MLRSDDIKLLVKSVENWQDESNLARGGVSGEKVEERIT